MDKKEDKNFEYNDEFCEECGCGVDCDDPLHDEREDLEFHNVNEESIMHLVLDDDTELDCMVLGFFQVEECEYIALLPVDEEQAESGVLLYEYVELDDDAFDLLSIDDDKEFEYVSEAFYELFSDEEVHKYETHYHEHEDEFIEYENYDELED
jgi:uncharacterized protein DUF1292